MKIHVETIDWLHFWKKFFLNLGLHLVLEFWGNFPDSITSDFSFTPGMKLYQCTMNLFQFGMNLFYFGMNLYQDRFAHTDDRKYEALTTSNSA